MKIATVASAASDPDEEEAKVAALVVEENKVIELSGPLMEVLGVKQKVCGLPAIIDMGSPVSFVSSEVYETKIKNYKKLEPCDKKCRGLENKRLELLGVVQVY